MKCTDTIMKNETNNDCKSFIIILIIYFFWNTLCNTDAEESVSTSEVNTIATEKNKKHYSKMNRGNYWAVIKCCWI